MTPDEICLGVIDRRLVVIDTEAGLAYRIRQRKTPVLLGVPNRSGYRVCTLHLDGHRQQVKLHRLIWIAANGPIPDGMVIDHINRVKNDNRIANLRLADASLNSANRRSYAGEGNPASKIDRITAEEVRRDHVATRSYAKTAARFGVSKSLVAQIVRGELWRSERDAGCLPQ